MAASTASQYLLRWNDHLSNYGDIFLSLREQEEFVDCSIACEDGIVGAHRVVLAGCSPYLRDLFTRVANPHPVIFLLNTSRSLVLMLMEFIYRGQVHVPQHRLQQLLVLGQALKIKGLTQIMMPVTGGSSDAGTPPSSIAPMAFPHGLPLRSSSSLPFTTITSNTNNLDVSLLSCPNEQHISEEKSGSRDKPVEKEDNPDNELERQVTSSSKKKRRRLKQSRIMKNAKGSQCPKISHALYSSSKERSLLGAYALQHGIDATRRYIWEKYSTKMRDSTIRGLISWHKKYQAKKNAKQKYKTIRWQGVQE